MYHTQRKLDELMESRLYNSEKPETLMHAIFHAFGLYIKRDKSIVKRS